MSRLLYYTSQNTQPEYDTISDSDCSKNKPAKSSPDYLNPVETLTRDRPKLASNDYDSVWNDDYSSARRAYSNILHDPLKYSNTPDPTLSYSAAYDDTTISASMSARDEEAIYSDPGHSEEAIYSCFERKKFRTINANTVR